jgi:CubicO group peptidase (beta-lactamase class C family)
MKRPSAVAREVNAAVVGARAGLDHDRLARLDAYLRELPASGAIAGSVTSISRCGIPVWEGAIGWRDLASKAAIARDSVFRIHSLTKPITAVVMMLLFERGHWHPADPLAKHLPELDGLAVLDSPDDMKFRSPSRQPTMLDLMTHRAGFSYGFTQEPIDVLYREAALWSADGLGDFVNRVASLPLATDPGEAWRYSIAVDLQGAIIERLTGLTLSDAFGQLLFSPLGMEDTGFWLEPRQMQRLSTLYAPNDDEILIEVSDFPFSLDHTQRPPPILSAGAGLISTAPDLARFLELLRTGCTPSGGTLLAPSSRAMMMSNHLPFDQRDRGWGIGLQQLRPGIGFGFNMTVVDDPRLAAEPMGRGTCLFDGAAGNFAWVDPETEIVGLCLFQRLPNGKPMPPIQHIVRALVYQSYVDCGL